MYQPATRKTTASIAIAQMQHTGVAMTFWTQAQNWGDWRQPQPIRDTSNVMCQHVPTITGAGMIQLTLTLIPVPILVICFSWGSVQSLHVLRCYGKRERLESKFCRHSGEFKMPCAGPPNMWRNSGYRRMETKMGPKTWLSRDYCLLLIMFP